MANQEKRILAINLGSTSTMVSIFTGKEEIVKLSISHSMDDLKENPGIEAQYKFRKVLVEQALEEHNITFSSLDALAVRGMGAPGRYSSGAYLIDDTLAEGARQGNHVGLAAAPIMANEWSKQYGIPAYLYDVVATDEIWDIARVSGSPLIERAGSVHTLNTKAVARRAAEDMGKSYETVTLILVHLGGGISTGLHQNGRIVEGFATDEGTFTPDRSGRLPMKKFAKLCTSGNYDKKQINAILTGNAGLIGYLGTNDCREIEARIQEGDKKAELVYQAMAYQIAKDIGSLAAVAKGKIDGIILTGGIAYSELFTGWIKEYVEFLAPVQIYPGSMEMEALAKGITRVLNGEEIAKKYIPGETVL